MSTETSTIFTVFKGDLLMMLTHLYMLFLDLPLSTNPDCPEANLQITFSKFSLWFSSNNQFYLLIALDCDQIHLENNPYQTDLGKLRQPEYFRQDSVVQLLRIPLPDFRQFNQFLPCFFWGIAMCQWPFTSPCECDDNFAWYFVFWMDLNGADCWCIKVSLPEREWKSKGMKWDIIRLWNEIQSNKLWRIWNLGLVMTKWIL